MSRYISKSYGYQFEGKWHFIEASEVAAIERSGKCGIEQYINEPPPTPLTYGALLHMADRPGKTEPGSSSVQVRLVGREVKKWISMWSFEKGKPKHDKRWTQDDGEKLWRLACRGYAWWHVAEMLDRTVEGCKQRYRYEGRTRGVKVSTKALVK